MLSALSTLTQPAVDATSCTATNVLKDLEYKVFYTDDNSIGNFVIQNIVVDILLQQSLKLDPSFCTTSPKGIAQFTQSFKIKFIAGRTTTNDYTINGIA